MVVQEGLVAGCVGEFGGGEAVAEGRGGEVVEGVFVDLYIFYLIFFGLLLRVRGERGGISSTLAIRARK